MTVELRPVAGEREFADRRNGITSIGQISDPEEVWRWEKRLS